MTEDKHASTGRMPSDIDGDEHPIRCSGCGYSVASERITLVYGRPICDNCMGYRRAAK